MILIKNAQIINENRVFKGHVFIKNGFIESIFEQEQIPTDINLELVDIIDANGLYLIPGVIDDQVHFREPGLTHKGNIESESKAAVAGGITSFMEMPNTIPNALSQSILQDKYDIASRTSWANYSFYMGVSNDNLKEVLNTDPKTVCGLKIFMGSSTGNMLVDNEKTLENIFSKTNLLIATHCEDENTIQKNLEQAKVQYGSNIPVSQHPLIRSEEACYLSSQKAITLAKKYNTRLHILHISTARELELFESNIPLSQKRITSEACIHHLWFCDEDYQSKGNFIKWNPAIKTKRDRDAILRAVINNTIDVIATDHAPHTLEEKQKNYTEVPSGGPLVQHALPTMLELYKQGKITLEKIVEKMCHNPAICFHIEKRGYIRPGYYADLVLIDLNQNTTVTKDNILYHCGWSPFEGETFRAKITYTIINGKVVYHNGQFKERHAGMRLQFYT